MGSGRSLPGPARPRRSPRLPPVCYLESSALVKLAIEEAESDETRFFISGVRWASSELVVTELPRAIRHRAAIDPRVDLAVSLNKTEAALRKLALHPIERAALWRAGRIFEPHLRSLDAIHVVTALELGPIKAFVTYDQRQAAAARDAGLPIASPGMKR